MSNDKPEATTQPDKRRLIANGVLVVAWLYVGMIYLLACDQQFHWGIFSP